MGNRPLTFEMYNTSNIPAQNKKVITKRIVLASICLSVLIHLFLILFLVQRCRYSKNSEFWIFFFVNIVFYTIGFLPIISLLAKRLQWFDPLLIFSLVIFSGGIAIFPSFLIDSNSLLLLTLRSSVHFASASPISWIKNWTEAQLILATFLLLLLLFNQNNISIKPSKTNEKSK